MLPPNHLTNYSAYLQLMRVHRPIETVQETLARHVLPVENPYGVGYFTGFLLSQERRMLVFCTARLARSCYYGRPYGLCGSLAKDRPSRL